MDTPIANMTPLHVIYTIM